MQRLSKNTQRFAPYSLCLLLTEAHCSTTPSALRRADAPHRTAQGTQRRRGAHRGKGTRKAVASYPAPPRACQTE
eukprot:574091-Rhodomonas_salina.1